MSGLIPWSASPLPVCLPVFMDAGYYGYMSEKGSANSEKPQKSRKTALPGRNLDDDVLEELDHLLLNKNFSVKETTALLGRDPRFQGRAPSENTVRDRRNYLRERDATQPWSLEDADVEDARRILPVLKDAWQRSGGRRRSLTRREADWVARLQGVSPTLTPEGTLKLALRYIARVSEGESTASLDLGLAFAPWSSDDANVAYREVIERTDSAQLSHIVWLDAVYCQFLGGGASVDRWFATLDANEQGGQLDGQDAPQGERPDGGGLDG